MDKLNNYLKFLVVFGGLCSCALLIFVGYIAGRKIHVYSPVNCEWQNWDQWSNCSQECGTNGTQHRIRSYSIQANNGGSNCDGNHFEERPCNVFCYNGGTALLGQKRCECRNRFTGKCCKCKIKDCEISKWSDWSTCSRECGPFGTKFRTRNIEQTPECGGTACTSSLIDEQPCNRKCYNSGRIKDGICKCPSGYSGECCGCKIKHCEMTEWSKWSQCSHECGPLGTRYKIRDIQQSPECGGRTCPSVFSEQEKCNRKCYNGGRLIGSENGCRCPIGYNGTCCECKIQNCVLTSWSDWSTCSKTCGDLGIRFRTRVVGKFPECGGIACTSELTQQQPCNRFCQNKGTLSERGCNCPIGYNGTCCECKVQNCVITSWSDWSTCSERCGDLGTRFRTRVVDKFPECGGIACTSELTQQQPCNRLCYNGGSLIALAKDCRCPDGFGGQCCDINVQDCAMIPWSQWSSCSHTCGPLGKRFRTRDIDRSSVCEKTMFPSELSEEQSCNRICQNKGTLSERGCICPIGYNGMCCECKIQNCVFTSWSDWSTCSKTCGDHGMRFRTRMVDKFPECGGIACTSELTQQQPCNRFCQNKGTLSERGCNCPIGYNGTCCECKIQNCVITSWSDWSTCSERCGDLGTRFRTRVVDKFPECGGIACTSELTQQQPCNRICFNGGSLIALAKDCRCPDGFGGQCCDINVQDCAMIPWSQWSPCSYTCGPLGKQFRTRDIDRSAVCEKPMFPSLLSEERSCNQFCLNRGTLSESRCVCPVGYNGQCCECKIKNCIMNTWSIWSPCSETCGPFGKKFRTRNINQFPECGGDACTSILTEEQPCNRICFNGGTVWPGSCNCPSGFTGKCCECEIKHCKMTEWSEWSPCSHACGPLGTQFRVREILQSPECGGRTCPSAISEQQTCNQICYNGGSLVASEKSCRCPDGFIGQCCGDKLQDCAMITWSHWSSCSHTCGPLGKQFRTRDIDRSSVCGQTMFPSSLSEEKSCNQFCLNRGTLSESRCDCQDGYNGHCCECKIQDCVMSVWSEWSACSKKCGPLGKQFRTRNAIKEPACGGVVCPIRLTDQISCNQFCYNSGILKPQEEKCSCQEGFSGDCCECVNQDCSLSEWSNWSSCENATRQIRTRDVLKYAKCEGKRCDGSLTDERSCAALLKVNVLVSKAGIGVLGGYAVLVTYMFGMAVLYFFRKHKKRQNQPIQNNYRSVSTRPDQLEMEPMNSQTQKQKCRYDQNDDCASIESGEVLSF